MCEPQAKNNLSAIPEDAAQKLMVAGYVCPENSCALSREVRRGMQILAEDGLAVGRVAAVVISRENCRATHLLLSRLPEERGYRLVPAGAIAEVLPESVRLSLPGPAVEALPRWHSA